MDAHISIERPQENPEKIKIERTIQDRTKNGPFFDVLYFSIF